MNVNARYCVNLHRLARVLASDNLTADLAMKTELIAKVPFLDEYSRNVVRVAAFMVLEGELTGNRGAFQGDYESVCLPALCCVMLLRVILVSFQISPCG